MGVLTTQSQIANTAHTVAVVDRQQVQVGVVTFNMFLIIHGQCTLTIYHRLTQPPVHPQF